MSLNKNLLYIPEFYITLFLLVLVFTPFVVSVLRLVLRSLGVVGSKMYRTIKTSLSIILRYKIALQFHSGRTTKRRFLNIKFGLYIPLLIFYSAASAINIMIDPIGDAKYTGREIEDTFERSLTLQCAQKLKEQIEETFPHAQVIITRTAGEALQPLQNASYANRMNVDLYLCLSFYHQENIPGHISIFYYLENNFDLQHKYNPFHFYHVSQAYLGNISVSSLMAKKLDSVFKQKNINPHFLCLGSFGVPCMPLFGIVPPALYLEAGLHHKNDWKYLIQPIIEALKEL